MTFWDVGAHIGFFSALAARLVAPGGRVHSFEPLPANRERLAQTVDLNGLADSVDIHGCAVAVRSGRAWLHAHGATTMWSLAGDGSDGVEVDVRTLDDLVAQLGVPDIVKIDIEGVEIEALCAARRLLRAGHTVFVVECLSAEVSSRLEQAVPHYEAVQVSRTHLLLRPRTCKGLRGRRRRWRW
jgi:FkbM family methyltransferase